MILTDTIKHPKQFNLFFLITSGVIFIIVALRSYYVPFNHDEAATFFMYIQSGKYMPFHSQVDANNHVLNSFLGNICFHLFGSSPFSMRIPNLIGFLILIGSVYKISQSLQQLGSKVFLTIAFLVSFHWLTFFSVCRGYGLSMALLIAGIAYVLSYISDTNKIGFFYASILFFQLAISSNLILIIVVLVLSGMMLIVQLINRRLVKPLVLLVWFIHAVAIYYWLSFSFYLQDNGALYYGAGESYWKVTFVSLVQLLLGFSTSFIKWVLIVAFLITVSLTVYLNKSLLLKLYDQLRKPSYPLLFLVVLAVLSVGFYAMHKTMGVNYPEDRTGLFFYVFFVLLVCFSFDQLPLKINKIVLSVLSILFVTHFAWNLDFRKHSLGTYETIPQHFYETLLKEQQKTPERITIGGHRVRELFFGFMNYRNGGYLNPADPTETMQMNCDYYIATQLEKKYFDNYYDVIDTEPDWGFLVLKRKEKMIKNKLVDLKDISITNNSNEFIEIYHQGDTTFTNTKPLIAEVNFDIEHISVPTNTWLVFQINDGEDQTLYFKRYPLQWTGYDNNGKKNLSYSLTSGNLPSHTKKIVCFFWNIDQQPLSIHVNSLKLFQLDGNGVEYVAPDIK